MRTAAPPVEWIPSGIERVTMKKLLHALSRALERLPAATPPPERMQRAMINVAERRQMVLSFVQRPGSASFLRIIADCRTRLEAIVTFIAVLDLLKTDDLRAEQDASFGDIVLHLPDHSPSAEQTA